MYQPAAFRETRVERIDDLLQACPLAALTVADGQGFAVDHVPLLRSGPVLRGHVARANPLAQRDGAPVVAVFQGPQAYVSPNWYPSKHETGREVPTWNYAVVHVHGRLRTTTDPLWLRALLTELTDRHEAGEPQPWSIDDAPADHTERLLGAITGIEIAIERIEAKFKLSQNHPPANRLGVVAGLRRRGRAGDAELAAWMVRIEESRT